MHQYSAVNTILVNNDANRNMLNVTSKVHFVSGWLRFVKGCITEKESDDIIESACNL